jgi:hypothetical protein
MAHEKWAPQPLRNDWYIRKARLNHCEVTVAAAPLRREHLGVLVRRELLGRARHLGEQRDAAEWF